MPKEIHRLSKAITSLPVGLVLTEVAITRLPTPIGKQVAVIDLTFNNVFAVKGGRLLNGQNGLFLRPADRQVAAGVYEPFWLIINRPAAFEIQHSVLCCYLGTAEATLDAPMTTPDFNIDGWNPAEEI